MPNDPIAEEAVELYSRAISQGIARGYAEGRAATRQEFIQKLKTIIAELEKEPPLPPTITVFQSNPAPIRLTTETGRLPKSGSDQDSVLQAIRKEPGLRGVDIVSRLAGSVQERTVRTSLHRLKTRGLIEPRLGKWWPKTADQQGEIEFQKFEGQSAPTD